MNSKGVTIVELLIVLVIIGVIATFTVINVTEAQNRARIKADTNNIVVLNQMTQDYAMINGVTSSDIFDGIDSNAERINTLVSEGYISHEPIPAQLDSEYSWNVDEQYWYLIGGELSSTPSNGTSSFDFSVDFKSALADSGVIFRNESRWNDEDGYLENDPGERRLFVPIGSTTYVIEVSAALSTGANGGYGVFFDTVLEDGDENKDSGFILQFDRGYAGGALIVRPRSFGREQGAVWQLRASSSVLLPTNSEDPTWWSSTHSIKISVSSSGGNERSATFYVDGVEMGTYSYTKDIEDEILYTGFRTWSNPTTKFYSININ